MNRPKQNAKMCGQRLPRACILEDWAETWAHYLQCVDTLETAMILIRVQGNKVR